MAYSRQYTYKSFNASTAILYVSVDLYDGATLIESIGTFPIKLPVDGSGNVPTGSTLTNFIDFVLGNVWSDSILDVKAAILSAGGTVANASDIYALTEEEEPDQNDIIPGGTGIPVLLVPIGGISNFTASVLISLVVDAVVPEVDVYRSRLPSPYGGVIPGVYTLDNGNIDGADIINIRGNDDTSSPFVTLNNITWINSSVPQGVIDAWPYVYNYPDYTDTLSFFYIEHDPISIQGNWGIGVFLYS